MFNSQIDIITNLGVIATELLKPVYFAHKFNFGNNLSIQIRIAGEVLSPNKNILPTSTTVSEFLKYHTTNFSHKLLIFPREI